MTAYPIPLHSITALVIGLHAVLLGWILWFAPVVVLPAKSKKFSVQTVQLQPKAAAAAKKEAQPIAQAVKIPAKEPAAIVKPKQIPKAVPKVIPKPKPEMKKKEVPKKIVKPTPQPVVVPKKNTPTKDALAAVKQKLASIPAVSTLTAAPAASADSPSGYEEGLVARLRILLKLPEMGDVRVALTLNRQGKVIKTEILSAANQANRKAVETHLPTIQFSPFGQAFSGEITHTFTLTLTNL